LWGDEFATWGTAVLPMRRGLELIRGVDAVLAPYYLVMKGWIQLAGDSDTTLRLPSVIALAGAAAVVAAIGHQMSGPWAGGISGVLFAGLPIVSRYAQEVRPYAFATLFAALATYLFLRLVQDGRRRWYLAYSAALVLVGLSHLLALTILVAHGAGIVARRRPRLALGWAAAAAVAVLALSPLLLAAFSQRGQVAWVGVVSLPVEYYVACLGGSMIGGLLVCLLASHSRPFDHPDGLVIVAWALGPPLLFLALSPAMDFLLPRYLLFVVPAWTLLAGRALARTPAAWAVAAVVTLALLAVPQHLAIRTGGGHENQDSRAMALMISRWYEPGDGVVFAAPDGEWSCCSWLARDAVAHYVPADRRPRDPLLLSPPRSDGEIRAVERRDVAAALAGTRRLWVVRLQYRPDPLAGLGDGKEQVVRAGFRQVGVWYPRGFTVALLSARYPGAR
jgi:mannosyltransferase